MSNYLLVIHIVELLAALAGSYYLYKANDGQLKIFVWYLWVIVGVETTGMYGYILQNNYDNELFIWIKNSVFCSNKWLYNLFSFFTIILLGKFYLNIIEDDISKRVIKISVIAYVFFTLSYYILSGDFFRRSLPYDVLLEALLIFVFVMIYYRKLLKSDKILFFYKLPIFYLSSGLLLWYLCVTPLFIFDAYLTTVNYNFLKFRNFYLLVANSLLYLCYTFGFLYTIQFKK